MRLKICPPTNPVCNPISSIKRRKFNRRTRISILHKKRMSAAGQVLRCADIWVSQFFNGWITLTFTLFRTLTTLYKCLSKTGRTSAALDGCLHRKSVLFGSPQYATKKLFKGFLPTKKNNKRFFFFVSLSVLRGKFWMRDFGKYSTRTVLTKISLGLLLLNLGDRTKGPH